MTALSGCAVDITDPVNDGCTIICGDANGDEAINLGRRGVHHQLLFQRRGVARSAVRRDANGDGVVKSRRGVHLINYIFKGGPPPVEPCCP